VTQLPWIQVPWSLSSILSLLPHCCLKGSVEDTRISFHFHTHFRDLNSESNPFSPDPEALGTWNKFNGKLKRSHSPSRQILFRILTAFPWCLSTSFVINLSEFKVRKLDDEFGKPWNGSPASKDISICVDDSCF
jgi:hypothetical protein